jgi:type I restriction enzyme S subunit
MKPAMAANKTKKALVPKLRFLNLSERWSTKLYGDIYSFYTTNSFSRDNLNYENGEIKNIHYGDIHTKYATLFNIQKEEVPFVNNDIDLKKIKQESYCQEKDLVIADASEDYADIGKTIELINLNNEKIIAGLHTFLARPNKHVMAKGFAGYLVQSWNFRKQVMIIAQGTKVLSLSTGRLAKVKLHLPTLPEQQKIAAFLSAVDEKIQQLTRKKVLLEQYKKGVMQQLFPSTGSGQRSGKLRFKDSNGKAYPNWEEKRLDEVVSKFIVPMRDKPKDLSGPIPWCRIEDFDGKYLSKSKSNQGVNLETIKGMNLKVYPVGTLLVSCSANLGFCAITKAELITNQTFIGLVTDIKKIDVLYLLYVMRRSSIKLNILSSGTTISYLSREQFEKFKIPYPCLSEQNKLALCISNLDDKIDSVAHEITQTQTFKKGLLQQMFV